VVRHTCLAARLIRVEGRCIDSDPAASIPPSCKPSEPSITEMPWEYPSIGDACISLGNRRVSAGELGAIGSALDGVAASCDARTVVTGDTGPPGATRWLRVHVAEAATPSTKARVSPTRPRLSPPTDAAACSKLNDSFVAAPVDVAVAGVYVPRGFICSSSVRLDDVLPGRTGNAGGSDRGVPRGGGCVAEVVAPWNSPREAPPVTVLAAELHTNA
jgi:hypothetical protein